MLKVRGNTLICFLKDLSRLKKAVEKRGKKLQRFNSEPEDPFSLTPHQNTSLENEAAARQRV